MWARCATDGCKALAAADRVHASPARAKGLPGHVGGADRTFEVFGRRQDCERDFGPFDLAGGRAAAGAVFPRIHAWLRAPTP